MELQKEEFCWCNTPCLDVNDRIKCKVCLKYQHLGCLKNGRPSSLAGDVFFELTCRKCNDDEEIVERMKLNWVHILSLSLFNLQLQEHGKCGYYRWREHICNFIEKNWKLFFGESKKKNSNWRGSIAGCLSNGCPQYFESGTAVLKEHGWWKLSKPRISDLFTPEKLANPPNKPTPNRSRASQDNLVIQEPICASRTRKKTKNSIQSAIELKERKSATREAKEIRKSKSNSTLKNEEENLELNQNLNVGSSSKIVSFEAIPSSVSGKNEPPLVPMEEETSTIVIKAEVSDGGPSEIKKDPNEFRSSEELASLHIKKEPSNVNTISKSDAETMNMLDKLFNQEEDEEDLEVDVGCLDVSAVTSKIESNIIDIPEVMADSTNVKEEAMETEELNKQEEESFEKNAKKNIENPVELQVKQVTVEKKSRIECLLEEMKKSPCKLKALSVYEECLLLNKLKKLQSAVDENPKARRLRRKLLLRKLKYERSLPVFDLNSQISNILGKKEPQHFEPVNRRSLDKNVDRRILDRFQCVPSMRSKLSQKSTCNFITKLMGRDEEKPTPIVSPYTGRILKPYIRRDYESKPLKLKLLNEIRRYFHNKNGCEMKKEENFPIDFSYVRPHHIPMINNLCKEFFWPGIDLSESLQYPDFSIVALYRKIVIGFAFMVPDVKCNEAYITYLFTHPDWRNAGIGTFMLYHLIQTCMGKDITLHVSARNPAMLLYQKFGFKVEEFILDFYDKYLPVDSKDCRHAMFLRLGR